MLPIHGSWSIHPNPEKLYSKKIPPDMNQLKGLSERINLPSRFPEERQIVLPPASAMADLRFL